jgi:hypothetical protein
MIKRNTRQPPAKPATRGKFENPVTQEEWFCENVNEIKTIDGVEFLYVHAYASDRTFLMRRDALKKVRM